MKFFVTTILIGILAQLNAQPIITSFSPQTAPAGASIVIIGQNFNSTPSGNIVYFGGVKGQVLSATNASIVVKVPASAANSPISVLNTNTRLLATSSKSFFPNFSPGSGQNITKGSFGNAVNITSSVSPSWSPQHVAAGDIDNDGKPDLVMISRENTLSIFKNNCLPGVINAGSFSSPVDFTLTSDYGPRFVTLNDLDGDGRLDIIIANSYATFITVFKNISVTGVINTNSLDTKISIPTGDGALQLSMADIDSDGKSDIIATNSNQGDQNSISVLKNTSGSGNISFANFLKFSTGRGIRAVDVADFNLDGKLDIVTANQDDGSISVLINNGSKGVISSGTFLSAFSIMPPNGSIRDVKAEDINNDNLPDILMNGGVYVNTFNTGVLNANSFPILQPITNGYFINVADINGDGKKDVITSGEYSNPSVDQNISSLNPPNSTSFSGGIECNIGISPHKPIIADLDGDGRQDIITVNKGFNGLGISLGIVQNITGTAKIGKGYGIIQTSAPRLKLYVGDEANLTAKLFNQDGTVSAFQPTFSWTSNAPFRVEADHGKIQAFAVGSATIVVTDSLYDTANVLVEVLPDTVEIADGPANIVFEPMFVSAGTNSTFALPKYLVTDFGGNPQVDDINFVFDSSGVGVVSNQNVNLLNKAGAFELVAYANSKMLNGSLPVFVHNKSAATVKADTIYKIRINTAPTVFKRFREAAKPIILDVTRIVYPAHPAGAYVLPTINNYQDKADSFTVWKKDILGKNLENNLIAKYPGSTNVSVWYKKQSIVYKVMVAFDFAGTWRAKDKNNKNYTICFDSRFNPIDYNGNYYPSADPNVYGSFINGQVTFEAYQLVNKHITTLKYFDTTWLLNLIKVELGDISTFRTNYAGTNVSGPDFTAKWAGDINRFEIADDIVFTRTGSCGPDSLQKVLVGDSIRSWVFESDSLFAYNLKDITSFATFYKKSNRFINFLDTNEVNQGSFIPITFGNYTVADNSSIKAEFLDTVYFYYNNQLQSTSVSKNEEYLSVGDYNDSLINVTSYFHKRTILETGAVYYDSDDEPFSIYLLKNVPSVLPVTLIQFDAKGEKDEVLLKWSTSTEVNTKLFIIQRSLDGRNFEAIGTVNAAGNSTQVRNYTYVDRQAILYSGRLIYYRLLQTDSDGQQRFTDIKSVMIVNRRNLLSLQFNPVGNEALLNYTSLKAEKVSIRLIDVTGHTLLYRQAIVLTGANQLRLKTNGLSQGIYLVEVSTPTDRYIVRMVKE